VRRGTRPKQTRHPLDRARGLTAFGLYGWPPVQVASRSRSVLAFHDVLDDPLQTAFVKDQTRAATSRPAAAVRQPCGRERSTGPSLELFENELRLRVGGRHDHMHVLDAALAGVDHPTASAAGHIDRIPYATTLGGRQCQRGIGHRPHDRGVENLIGWTKITAAFHPAAWIPRKPRSVGCPRQEVRDRARVANAADVIRHNRSVRANSHTVEGQDGGILSAAPEALRPSACTGSHPLPVKAQRRKAWDAAKTDAASRWPRQRPYGLRLVRAATAWHRLLA